MKNQQQQEERTSLSQQIEGVNSKAVYPAITVLVFIRTHVGFRLMNPLWLAGMALLIVVIDGIYSSYVHVRSPNWSMEIYAGAMLVCGIVHRIKAWSATRKGVPWHSYSPGVSILEKIPLPHFLRIHRRTNRFLDPLLVGAIAIFARDYLSVPLGLWLIFSAFALALYELGVWQSSRDRDLDIADGLLAADIQSESAKHFERPPSSAQEQQDASIPTGLAPDIRKRLKRREKE